VKLAYTEEEFRFTPLSARQAMQIERVKNLKKIHEGLSKAKNNFENKTLKDSIIDGLRGVIYYEGIKQFATKEEQEKFSNDRIERLKGLSKVELGKEVESARNLRRDENSKLKRIVLSNAGRSRFEGTRLASAARFIGRYLDPREISTAYTLSKQRFESEMGRIELAARTEKARKAAMEPSQETIWSIITAPNHVMEWSYRNLLDNWMAMRNATNYYEMTAYTNITALTHAQSERRYIFGRLQAVEEELERVEKEIAKGRKEKEKLGIKQRIIGILPTGGVPIFSKVPGATGVQKSFSQKIISKYTLEQLKNKKQELERQRDFGGTRLGETNKAVKAKMTEIDRQIIMLDNRKNADWAIDAMRDEVRKFREQNEERLRSLREWNKAKEELEKYQKTLNQTTDKELIERNKKQIATIEGFINQTTKEVRLKAEQILVFRTVSEEAKKSVIMDQTERDNTLKDIGVGQSQFMEKNILLQKEEGELRFVAKDKNNKEMKNLAYKLNKYLDRHNVDASKYTKPSEIFDELKGRVREDYSVNVMYRIRELGRQLGLPFPGKEGSLRIRLKDEEKEYLELRQRVEVLKLEDKKAKNRLSEGERDILNRYEVARHKVNVTNAQIYLYALELFGVVEPIEGVKFDRIRDEIDKLDREREQAKGSPEKLGNKIDEYTKKAVTYQFASFLKRGELDTFKDPETGPLKPSYGRLTARESMTELERLRREYPELEFPARKLVLKTETKDDKERLAVLSDKREKASVRRQSIDLGIETIFATSLSKETLKQYKDAPLSAKIGELAPQLDPSSKKEFDHLLKMRKEQHAIINDLDREIRGLKIKTDYLGDITKHYPYDPMHSKALDKLKQWWGPSWYGSRLERFSRWVKGEGSYEAFVPDQRRKVELSREITLLHRAVEELHRPEKALTEYEKEEVKELMKNSRISPLRGWTEENLKKIIRKKEDDVRTAGRWVVKKHPGMEYVMESPEYRWVKPLYKAGRWALIAGAIAGGITAPLLGITLAAPLLAKKGAEKVADWGMYSGAIAPGSSERALHDIQIVEYWTTRGRGSFPVGALEAWNDYVYYSEFYKRGTRITADGELYFHKDSIKLKPVGMDGIFYPLRLLKGIVEPPTLDIAARMRLDLSADLLPGGKPALKATLIENPYVKAEIEDVTPHQRYKVLGGETRPYPELAQSFLGHPEQWLGMPFQEAALYTHVMRNETLNIAEREESRMFKEKLELDNAYKIMGEVGTYERMLDEASVEPVRYEGMKSAYIHKLHRATDQLDSSITLMSRPNAKPEDEVKISEMRANRARYELALSSLGASTSIASRDELKQNAKAAYSDWRGKVNEELEKAKKYQDVWKEGDCKVRIQMINAALTELSTT
jgi:hypothetical protein